MKLDIATKWVTKLRSGEYEQGRGYLCDGDKYCCLGVLCEMAVEEGIAAKVQTLSGMGYVEGTSAPWQAVLGECVQNWAGLHGPTGKAVQMEDGQLQTVANLNDEGLTFAEIADIIELNAERL